MEAITITTPLTISELIAIKLLEHNLSRQQLITKIGYKNITKGLRKLDTFLETLNGPEVFIRKLVKILEIEALEYYKAMIFSQEKIHNKPVLDKKYKFLPYIDLIFDFTPRHLIVNNFIFDSSHIISTNIRNLPLQEELDEVINIYKKYIDKLSFTYFTFDDYTRIFLEPTLEENRMFRECVVGFRYHRHFHYFFEFNADCVLTKIESRESLPDRISIKDKKIIENLRSHYRSFKYSWID